MRSEIAAIEANLAAFLREYRRDPEAEVHTGAVDWSLTGVPAPFFNCVVRTTLTPATIDDTMAEVLDRCRARRVPLLWWVNPSATPSDLARHLTEAGLTFLDDVPGMAMPLAALPARTEPAGITTRTVHDAATLHDFITVLGEVFAIDEPCRAGAQRLFGAMGHGEDRPWRHYVAYDHDVPVGTASCMRDGDAAGIYNVGVLPSHRGRGLGAYLTVHPLQEARSAGCTLGVLHASREGHPVYRALGFADRCTFKLYLFTPA